MTIKTIVLGIYYFTNYHLIKNYNHNIKGFGMRQYIILITQNQ